MFIRSCFLAAVLSTAAGLCACSSTDSFTIADTRIPQIEFPQQVYGSVAVMPFTDARAASMQGTTADSGSLYFGLIPLMPFGFETMRIPERSKDFVSLGYFQFRPSHDLTDAAFNSLQKSGLFREVKRGSAVNPAKAEYVFTGTLRNSEYEGYMLSYGITYFLSPVLWLVGCPYGVSYNTLWLDYQLKEQATGRVVWSFSTQSTDSITHWIYARWGKDCTVYSRLMVQSLNTALSDLAAHGNGGQAR